jgi:Flp pilus assembly protein TadG
MVEMALVMSLFVIPLILGMLETSRFCMVSQLLTNAAREGCRVAVKNGKTSSDVTTRVNATLSAAGIASNLLTIAITIPTGRTSLQTTQLGDSINVNVSVYYSTVRLLPYSFLFGSTTQVSGSATMSSEHP